MKTFRIASLAALAVFALSLTALAQPGPPPGRGQGAARLDKWMVENLDLSEGQTEKVKAINAKYAERRKAVMESARESGDRQTARQKMETIRAEHEAELREVLDDQQWAKYEAKRDEVMEKREKAKDPEQRAAAQTKWMAENLKLSEPQVEKVEEINLRYAKKAQELMEANEGDRGAMRKGMALLRRDKDEELKEVFDKEQWAAYEKKRKEMKEEMRERRGKGRGEGGR